MRKPLLFTILLLGQMAYGQTTDHRHALKADLSALWRHGWGAGYSVCISEQHALEFAFTHEAYPDQPAHLFHGDYIAHYIGRTTEVRNSYDGELTARPEEYLGDGKPLAPIASSLPLSTWQARLGLRFYLGNKTHYRFFVQPGLSMTHHAFFDILQRSEIERRTKDIYLTPDYGLLEYTQYTTYYRDVRNMRRHDTWMGGLTYDAGLMLTRGRLLLEGGLTGGINFPTPYKGHPPALVQGLYARFLLRAGWVFGGKKKVKAEGEQASL